MGRRLEGVRVTDLSFEEYRALVLRAEQERYAAALDALAEARFAAVKAEARASRVTRRCARG